MPEQALYDRDFLEWTRREAAVLREALRAGVNLPLDWEHIAEEIETLGRSERGELGNRVGTILEHLLKLRFSPAPLPGNGWKVTVVRNRDAILEILERSPSLRRDVPDVIATRMRGAQKAAALGLADFGEKIPANVPPFTPDQVLGDWFPDEPRAEP